MSVVLIVADSLRHDMLGCCGGPVESPTVDGLAAAGATFERVISAAPWTVPSLGAMLTGVYAHRLGLAKWEQPWPQQHPTLFDAAAAAGYRVASFVFDPAHLFRRVPSAGVCGSSQNTEGLHRWLDEHRGEPYLLLIHYWWTHVPYVSRPMSVATWRQVTDKVIAGMRASPAAREGVKKLYRLGIHRFSEEWLPGILERLDLDTTWTVITSDHGESWGEREETAALDDVFDLHGNHLYDEGLRIPLIIRPPGGGAEQRIGGLARSVDLLPTLAELAELPLDDGDRDGISLAANVRHGGPAPAARAISARNRDFVDLPDLPQEPGQLWRGLALTGTRYKQIWEPDGDRRLAFDLESDPDETLDISDRAIPELEQGWQQLAGEMARARVGKVLPDDVERVREGLRKLGYLE